MPPPPRWHNVLIWSVVAFLLLAALAAGVAVRVATGERFRAGDAVRGLFR